MSSPHVAGLAALFKDLHPGWSPMAIKSALMTTGTDILDGPNTNPLVIFRQGAGHVTPTARRTRASCSTPASTTGWRSCAGRRGRRPGDLRRSSRALGYQPRRERLQRRLDRDRRPRRHPDGHPHGDQRQRRHARPTSSSLTGLAGIDVESARRLHARPGRERDVRDHVHPHHRDPQRLRRRPAHLVRRRARRPQSRWSSGRSRSPRRPRSTRTAAPISYDVEFGYDGAVHGDVRAASSRRRPPTAPSPTTRPTTSTRPIRPQPGHHRRTTSWSPPGPRTPASRCSTRTSTAGTDTRPVRVPRRRRRRPDARRRSAAAAPRRRRSTSPTRPPRRTASSSTGSTPPGGTASYTLFTWVLGTADAGNMTVTAPATAVTGATGTVELSFSGLTAGTKYLGSVVYGGGASSSEPDDRPGRHPVASPPTERPASPAPRPHEDGPGSRRGRFEFENGRSGAADEDGVDGAGA